MRHWLLPIFIATCGASTPVFAQACALTNPDLQPYHDERKQCVAAHDAATEARECMHAVDLKYGQYDVPLALDGGHE